MYHLAYITDDVNSHLFGDMEVHEGPKETCEQGYCNGEEEEEATTV